MGKIILPNCDIMKLHKLFGKKWTMLILHRIHLSDVPFNQLKKETKNQITSSNISCTLKELLKYKLIIKTKTKDKLMYGISKQGNELMEMMHLFKEWLIKNNYHIPEECKNNSCYCEKVFIKKNISKIN